ncbi:HTH domain-containing protein [Geosporobacter ferrireducens]|uniref:Helix-turn-helix type 11 domain-containing protein n=1 Tax=Geosporobacter ferrireducens TaxID=1424294 RepID=A0A1D8GDL4_9FIRM|nr:HTH domain-containing protein [Geosporobacter ferrireducens]AOT68991.1 hypothetical protein Gferi_05120 [Geosporobacter ferrireducens]
MVPLTKRQKDIVEYLTGTDDYAKIKTLSHEFGVSERTVRYDLDVIECYLKSEGFELVKKPGVGIKIQTCRTSLKGSLVFSQTLPIGSSPRRKEVFLL